MTLPISVPRYACALAAVALGAACSNGGSGGAPVAASPTILTTSPPDGAFDVDPTAAVTIDIALPVGGSPNGDVTVSDGVHVLPGSFEMVQGATWRWIPESELPRGSTVELASRTQGRVAQFTVREAATRRIYELPGVTVDDVMVWPNGRSAVFGDSRCFEVTTAGTAERFTNLRPDALPFGDGLAVFTEFDTSFQRWLVRTGLGGERDRVLMPTTSSAIDVNARGDVVTFTRENLTFPGQGGFWVLPFDGFAWERVGPFATFYQVVPKIADDGAVSGAWGEPDKVRCVRFAPGVLVPELFEAPATAPQPCWDVHGDGSGWLLWVIRDEPLWILRGVRYVSGQGFAAPVDLETWSPGPGFSYVQCSTSRAGGAGSTILELDVSGIGDAFRQFVRIERDGWISIPNAYSASSFDRQLLQSPVRSEVWSMLRSADEKELSFSRSRPRRQSELDRLLYRVPEPGLRVGPYHAALDDSGRVTVAFDVLGLGAGQQVARVVVLE